MKMLNGRDDGTAVITEDGRQISYAEIKRFCHAFQERMPDRSLLIIICSNTLECISGYIGSLMGEHVPLLLGPDTDFFMLSKYLEAYQPGYVWTKKEELVNELTEKQKFVKIFGMGEYVLLKTNYAKVKMNRELALLLTTSGTTGNLKTVRLSKENLLSNTQSICEYLKIEESHRAITTLPMNYTYGLSVVNTHFFSGATILLTDRSVIDRKFWDFFRKYQVTSLAGVPYTYELLCRMGIRKMELPSLRVMTQAGGALKEREWSYLSRYSEEHKSRFFVMYGQTEATARISYLAPEKMKRKMGSIGKAIPGGRLYVANEEGERIDSPYEKGQLIYEGPNVMMGYAVDVRDLISGNEQHGKLCTGDIGYSDEEGDFYVTGRMNRFTKIYGKRINLDDVEQNLCEKMGCQAVCITRGDEIVLLHEGGKDAEMAGIRELWERYGIGRKNIIPVKTGQIPHAASGKVDYKAAEKLIP
ncbi:MAG: AMP-binding protein [Roseburia sp.]|nr:AMP-binding protein [Roseburia sp.]